MKFGDSKLWRKKLSTDEISAKEVLIKELKKEHGICLNENFLGTSFRDPNILISEKNKISAIFYFHYSKDIGFYGYNAETVNDVVSKIGKNSYFFILLLYHKSDEKVSYFAIPAYLIKRLESSFSKSKGNQIKLELIEKNGKYYLKLLKGSTEEISQYKVTTKELFSEKLIKLHDEEKEKYEKKIGAQNEIISKFSK